MKLKNFIGGKWIESDALKSVSIMNPANGESLGEVPLSSKGEVDLAVSVAKDAQKNWALVPAPKRAEYLFEIGIKLREKKEYLAQVLTKEMGKVIEEARGEVQEGI